MKRKTAQSRLIIPDPSSKDNCNKIVKALSFILRLPLYLLLEISR